MTPHPEINDNMKGCAPQISRQLGLVFQVPLIGLKQSDCGEPIDDKMTLIQMPYTVTDFWDYPIWVCLTGITRL